MKNKSIKKFIICFASAAILICVILYLLGFRITYDPYLENNWDAISACAAWASVFVSGAALIFAIRIPKKIADEQNKIALFEKRYECFQTYEHCCCLYVDLLKYDDVEKLRNSVRFVFDIPLSDELDKSTMFHKTMSFEYDLHQMEFLFSFLSDKDIQNLYKTFIDIVFAIVNNENIKAKKVEYIDCMSLFQKKYNKSIFDELRLKQ